MFNHTRLISTLCLVLPITLWLQSCSQSSLSEFNENLSKAVVMKYVHVANVQMFQTRNGNTQSQFVGVNNGSFWAVFEICTLDVQGSALNGFSYNTDSFYIDAGNAKYSSATPDTINVSSVTMSSQAPLVIEAARNAFSLSPTTQFFPKQFYPNLKYRIAIFVKENPAGYHGEAMTLEYNGQPAVAALVENVTPGNPDFVSFYNHSVSSPIVGTCP